MRRFLILLVLLITSYGVYAQLTVSGKVTSVSDGEPLPGATVLVKGTTTGVVTDLDGNYTIEVPGSDATLVFSFVGYTNEEIKVAGQSKIDMQLFLDMVSLEDVVVIGYGQMKRSDLTGAVVSVGSEAVEKSVSTSLDQVLQGRAAGVQVQQNSGEPGAASSIRIRGINSLNGSNEPIFVIDGVIIDGSSPEVNGEKLSQNPLASINPADIVSMEVLKDASATAIYGSRGANGVIIITTKRGKKGEAAVSYNGYVGYQEIPSKLELLNLQEYAQHKNDRADAGIVTRDNNYITPSLLGEGTDWQEELFQRAQMKNHNLSISGGSEKGTYALGVGYLNQDGVAIGSGFERLSLRSSLESQVKDYLRAGINFSYSNSKQNTTVSDDDIIKVALKQTPNVAVRNADGSFDGPKDDEFAQNNPVALAMINTNRNEKVNMRASAFVEFTVLKDFKFKTEYSTDFNLTNGYRFYPTYTFGDKTKEVAEGTQSKSDSKYWSIRNILSYNKTLDKHTISAMLGQEAQKSYWEYLNGYAAGFLTNTETDLSLGDLSTNKTTSSSGPSAQMSAFGRLFYSYNNKYLLTTTLRYDGSTQFDPEYQWGWFPSAAVAWKVSNESFLESLAVINNLKLRLGWGAVGNQAIPNYAYISTYKPVASANWGPGLLSANTNNPQVQWETTYSSNMGVDLNMFQNRIEFIGDVYYKKTKNLLLAVPLPGYVGVGDRPGQALEPWKNIGSLENKGIELTLNTVNVDRNKFTWRTNFVFSVNRNKVLSMDSESGIIDKTIQEGSEVTVVTRTAVGSPIGQYYGYEIVGRFEEATDFFYKNEAGEVVPVALPDGESIGENSYWIGDLIIKDQNGDGVINSDDRTYIGNPEPDFICGFGNTFSYRGFELNVLLSGVFGNEVVNYQKRFLVNPRGNTNLLKDALGYAKLDLIDPNGPNDYRNVEIVSGDPYMPRMTSSASSTWNHVFSDRFVEDGSYLRIQNISFSYTFPKQWVTKVKIENFKVYANLQNVYTFTKYSGYDPEIGSLNQDALISGFDNARYPMPRMYTLGVNVTF